jgi:hypothetical protein
MVIVFVIESKVSGLKTPCRGRWIFKGDKNPQHDFFRKGSAVGRVS